MSGTAPTVADELHALAAELHRIATRRVDASDRNTIALLMHVSGILNVTASRLKP